MAARTTSEDPREGIRDYARWPAGTAGEAHPFGRHRGYRSRCIRPRVSVSSKRHSRLQPGRRRRYMREPIGQRVWKTALATWEPDEQSFDFSTISRGHCPNNPVSSRHLDCRGKPNKNMHTPARGCVILGWRGDSRHRCATPHISSLINSRFEAKVSHRRLLARAASVRALPILARGLRMVSAGRFRVAASP